MHKLGYRGGLMDRLLAYRQNTGWEGGSCHYFLSKDYELRLVDTGWCGVVTRTKYSWDVVEVIKTIEQLQQFCGLHGINIKLNLKSIFIRNGSFYPTLLQNFF